MDASTTELEAKKSTLQLAYEIFSQTDITSPSLQNVVQQGQKILSGLFKAEESRRVGRAARTLLAAGGSVPQDADDDDDETFAEVLQRISRSLNTSSAPHRGTPPPTRNIRRLNGSNKTPGVTGSGTDVPTASWLQSAATTTNDNAIDQSFQWLADLGMLEGDMTGKAAPTFGLDPQFDRDALGGQVDGTFGGLFDSVPDFMPDAVRMNGQGSQVSALLDQIGSGW